MAEYPPTIRARDFTDTRTASDPRPPRARDAQRSESSEKNTNTVNRQRFGVEKLYIKVGGKRSASHTKANHKKVLPDDGGRVHFVPRDPARVERPRQGPGETARICWKLHRPELVERVKIELFTRGANAALWTLDLVWDGGELVPDPGGPTQPSHDFPAEGSYDWDGCLGAVPPGMTEACVSVGGSPYKLKMTVEGRGGIVDAVRSPAEAWTYFDVLVRRIEITWGNTPDAKDVIPDVRADVAATWHAKVLLLEKAILDDLHAHPITDDQKIFLRSDLFTTDFNNEVGTDAPYRAYREKWGQGPLIPIFARLFLQSSADRSVSDAPWALDGAKVLWDWEDRGGDKSAAWLNAEKPATKDFVRKALDYYVDLHADQGHAPRGSNNCHVDHGGKRGPNAPPVFPQQAPANYTAATAAVLPTEFPFQVDPCPAPRPWASHSRPRTRGVLAGYTGVLFQPSRMAGDTYRVSAYLAYDGFPYRDDAATLQRDQPARLQKSTGWFEVWRKLQVRVLRKTNAAPNLAGTTVRDIYRAAGIEVEMVSNAVLNLPAWETSFDNQILALRGGAEPWFTQRAGDVYAAGPDCVFDDQKLTADGIAFRDRATLNPPNPGPWDTYYNTGPAGPGSRLANCSSSLLGLVQRDYVDTNFPTHPNPAHDIEGVFVFLFRYRCSHWPDQLEGAANSGISTPTRAIVNVSYEPGTPSRQIANYGPGLVVKGFDEVLAHEIGHALWLPHADAAGNAVDRVHLPHTPPPVPPGHDDNDSCLMNYHPSATRFCGVCNLRLRGWSVRGPVEGANAPEALVELFNAPDPNKRAFKLTRCRVSLPATPPKTKRLMHGSDTDYNVPDRATRDIHQKTKDLGANPPLVILTGTVVRVAIPDPACDAVARPIRLKAEGEFPNGAKVVWKIEREGSDHQDVIDASPMSLPSWREDAPDGSEIELQSNAVGTFHVMASVDPSGGNTFDPAAEFLCVNLVMVQVSRVESDHHFGTGHAYVDAPGGGGDVTFYSFQGNHLPMKVKTKIRLLGGGPSGTLGVDKVCGGWINNMRRSSTVADYADATGTNTWQGTTYMLHRKGDNTWEPLNPALDATHAIVDCGGGGSMANWQPYRAVLSTRAPEPTASLDQGARALKRGYERWIEAADGPSQGWDPEPYTQRGHGLDLQRFNLDNDFCAYLCFWTNDAPNLVGVLEEVPWSLHAVVSRHGNRFKLDEKKCEMAPKTKHETLVAAVRTGVEVHPPTSKTTEQPRNVTGTAIGTGWQNGHP